MNEPAIPLSHPLQDIDSYLGNSSRTDLFGGEMACDGGAHGEPSGAASIHARPGMPEEVTPDLWPGHELRGNIPQLDWAKPAFGLQGKWAFGNPTAMRDVLTIEVARLDGKNRTLLSFTPTRHRWTPSGTRTHYRSMPLAAPHFPYAGTLAISEEKCITDTGTFVTRWTLTHDEQSTARYEISLITPFPREPSTDLHRVDTRTQARSMGMDVPLTGHAAIAFADTVGTTREITLTPLASQTLVFGMAVDFGVGSGAMDLLMPDLGDADVFGKRKRSINRWFMDNVPRLDTADGDLMKVYYYRWFVVYAGRHNPSTKIPGHPYTKPCFYESPFGNWFGGVVGLSVGLQLQEAKWARTETAHAEGHIAQWVDGVGNYRSYVQFAPTAMVEYLEQRPLSLDLARLYESMKAFCREHVNPVDPGDFPVQVGSWPTGAEYQPNFYQFTAPPWDWRCDNEGVKGTDRQKARLIRLDTTVALIQNLRAAAHLGRRLGQGIEAESFEAQAKALVDRMKKELWDEKQGLFLGADPATRTLADQAACFDSFMPFLCPETHEAGYLKSFEAFFDPTQFWDEFPITTVSKKCPMYGSGNALIGPTASSVAEPHPYACSWNGPVWHFSNSFAAMALGSAASSDPGRFLREGWLTFMERWVDLHFLCGDRSVPMANEHSRPGDGARFRRFHEYFHSAFIDPFMKYWAGIRFDGEENRITFDPFTSEPFRLEGVPIGGREWTFDQIRVDGTLERRVVDDRGRQVGVTRDPGTPVSFSIS